jgi:uncharacterized protein
MNFHVSLLGFAVGLLVGLTGMGGGALMTPALILLGLARPAIAVGTDLACGALTKAVGAAVHSRQQTIDFTIVRRLAIGSIPGALVGLAVLANLHRNGPDAMDRFMIRMLAVALMCVSLSLFARIIRPSGAEAVGKPLYQRGPAWLTSVIGAVIGFIVSLTSVGSGSLIVASLVILYPATHIRRIVGSDILHGLILISISALGHIGIGDIDLPLLGALLLGSIPGVWIGGRMSAVFPERIIQPILATTLFLVGYKLL